MWIEGGVELVLYMVEWLHTFRRLVTNMVSLTDPTLTHQDNQLQSKSHLELARITGIKNPVAKRGIEQVQHRHEAASKQKHKHKTIGSR